MGARVTIAKAWALPGAGSGQHLMKAERLETDQRSFRSRLLNLARARASFLMSLSR